MTYLNMGDPIVHATTHQTEQNPHQMLSILSNKYEYQVLCMKKIILKNIIKKWCWYLHESKHKNYKKILTFISSSGQEKERVSCQS